MNDDVVIAVLSTCISLFGLYVLYFWLYRQYSKDLFQQRLFDLRDEMFDYALEHELPWSTEAYCHLRMIMNGLIRQVDRIDVATPIWARITGIYIEAKLRAEVVHLAIDQLPDRHREALNDFHDRMGEELTRFRTRTYPLATPIMMLAVPFMVRGDQARGPSENRSRFSLVATSCGADPEAVQFELLEQEDAAELATA